MNVECQSVVMSNMWFGLMKFEKAGSKVEEHKHMFDHTTLLAHGSFQIIKYDKNKNIILDELIESPCLIHIEKGLEHSIIATTDNAVACCCHAIYESEKDLFPIDESKVPVVGGSLKLSLLEMDDL